ncbi:hypothetical protein CYMTET_17520 [Cymbomonas tetramitiformis]|uniref:Uncharacterized protein n=1 Tax=Cymbomonas tetramitiformis TaxID=36881 RepID=A0AAE0L6W6_9CHLO|nr:hypothetical protein CYMTET_17520 [Cymbomonas tetramitiformis]
MEGISAHARFYKEMSWGRLALMILVTCLLPFVALTTGLLTSTSARAPLLCLLLGKFISYASSAFLHKSPTTSSSQLTHGYACQVDTFSICVSIFATGIPFASLHTAAFYGASGAIMALCAVLIATKAERPRLFVTLAQFISTVTFIGYVSSWHHVWVAGTLAYIGGFACYSPVAMRNGKGRTLVDATIESVPWHRIGRYGCHEDFHLLLLVGDICCFIVAITYSLGLK